MSPSGPLGCGLAGTDCMKISNLRKYYDGVRLRTGIYDVSQTCLEGLSCNVDVRFMTTSVPASMTAFRLYSNASYHSHTRLSDLIYVALAEYIPP